MRQPRKLIIAVLTLVHMSEVNITTDNRVEFTGGVEGMFMKDLLAALGFEYELVFPPDGQYGRQRSNGSWSGLLGMTMRGESDLGCCAIIMTDSRQKAVEFSLPYAFEHYTFVIKKPEEIRQLKNGYLYPFQAGVWACCFAVMVSMSLMVWVVLGKKHSLGRTAFELFRSALRQPFVLGGGGEVAWTAKFLLAILCVWSLVMTAAYSGTLLSFLTVSAKGDTIETLQQLSAAVSRGTHKCYELADTLLVPLLLGSSEEHLRLLGRAISRNKWHLDNADEDAFSKLSPNTAIISGTHVIDIVTQGTPEQRSKYIVSKDVLGTAFISIPMNRNFCCRKRLNRMIMRFGRAGMIQKYVREAAFKKYLSTPKIEEEIDKSHKISVDDITGALFVLGAGYAVSFITLLAEILLSKYNVRDLRL